MKNRKSKFKSELFPLLQIPQFAIVDIETTGGMQDFNRIIEIAVIITDGKKILNEYCSLVNPKRNIPEFITQITGISYEMVENAPTYEEIAPHLYELLKDCSFVAHNVNFDYTFIEREFRYAGIEYKSPKYCTVKLGKKLVKLPSYNLDSLCKHFNINIENRHRALGDALATTQLFHHYLKIIRNKFGEKQYLFEEEDTIE